MTNPARFGPGTAPVLRRGRSVGRESSANLGDILERVLDRGVVIAGDIRVNLLDIELLTIKLRLVIASVDTARELGIDWWEHDPWLTSKNRDLIEENRRLRRRLATWRETTPWRKTDAVTGETTPYGETTGVPLPRPAEERGRRRRPERRAAVTDSGTYVYAVARDVGHGRPGGSDGRGRGARARDRRMSVSSRT